MQNIWILVRYWLLVIPGEEAEVEEEEEEEEEQKGPDLKQASRRDMYSICQAAGLGLWSCRKLVILSALQDICFMEEWYCIPSVCQVHEDECEIIRLCGFSDGLAKKFGLTPEQFGENLRDSYQRHETEQFPAEPLELAKDYVCR